MVVSTACLARAAGLRESSAVGLFECAGACVFAEFCSRLFDVGELCPQGLEWVVIDGNQFDAVVERDDVVVVSISVPDLVREGEAPTVIELYHWHMLYYW